MTLVALVAVSHSVRRVRRRPMAMSFAAVAGVQYAAKL
jgi:hypothetical protein